MALHLPIIENSDLGGVQRLISRKIKNDAPVIYPFKSALGRVLKGVFGLGQGGALRTF